MAKKDVELFALEKRKNEALKKEWKKVAAREDKLKENQKEKFFNEKLYPIVKKYGFDFSFADFCEYKKFKGSNEELRDDELFNVARANGLANNGQMNIPKSNVGLLKGVQFIRGWDIVVNMLMTFFWNGYNYDDLSMDALCCL